MHSLTFSRAFLLNALVGVALSACTASSTEIVATQASRITSGRVDDADGAVVWIVAKVGGRSGYCSGVVVSPNVVLTAGHCAPDGATFSIFLGSDYNDAAAKAEPASFVAVAEQHQHPEYSATDNIHDLAVLVTTTRIPRTPIAIRRDPLTASDRGAPIRITGFGQTSSKDKTIGRRHEATTTISDYDATGLAMAGTPSFCLFDSGGPTLMTRGGAEVVVGIHSIMESATCDGKAWDVRVDAHADFVDDAIAKAARLVEADAAVSESVAGGVEDAALPPDGERPAAPTSTSGGCSSIGAAPNASIAPLPLALALGLLVRRSRRSLSRRQRRAR